MSNHRSRRRARGGLPASAFPSPQAVPPEDAPGHRQTRLERLILDELQSLLRDEASDPALEQIRLLSVELSVDAAHARVAYVVDAELQRAEEARRRSTAGLGRATSFLRARLAARLDLKRLPTLSFTFVGVAPEPIGGAPWLG